MTTSSCNRIFLREFRQICHSNIFCVFGLGLGLELDFEIGDLGHLLGSIILNMCSNLRLNMGLCDVEVGG